MPLPPCSPAPFLPFSSAQSRVGKWKIRNPKSEIRNCPFLPFPLSPLPLRPGGQPCGAAVPAAVQCRDNSKLKTKNSKLAGAPHAAPPCYHLREPTTGGRLTKPEPYKAHNKVRFVTAASLFDGHDAAINIMRRILQAHGAEVIHLGHNRSVKEIVDAAVQEDAQGIAVSSYQGGHIEFFKYMVDLLKERGAEHIKVYGGGGGVIVPREIKELEAYGVTKIFSPEDGRTMGLDGMIDVDDRGRRLRPRADGLHRPPRPHRRPLARRGARHHPGGRGHGGRDPEARQTRPGPRHHRHRRRRQVLAHRRDRPPLPRRRCRPHRRHPLDRPHQAKDRRRPPRRPDSTERPRLRPRLHALARHPPGPPRPHQEHRRLDRRLPGGRLRSDHRRELRHRPGRQRDRRHLRSLALRHDPRVRRRHAARKDRHAGLRRLRRHQQVRPADGARRPARRAQAVPPRPHPLRRPTRRRAAGLRHHRQPVPRPRRQRPLPGAGARPRREARRQLVARGHRRRARRRAPAPPGDPRRPRRLPARHLAHRARLQGLGDRPDQGGGQALPAHGRPRHPLAPRGRGHPRGPVEALRGDHRHRDHPRAQARRPRLPRSAACRRSSSTTRAS